ncbi:MAG: hypothetical protein AAF390_10770 [Pseudomonadota bacterium]
MRRFALILSLLPLACGAPHSLDRLDRTGRASAGGHLFRVNWNLETAQATRMSPARSPEHRQVTAAAVAATEAATGCQVIPGSALGDVTLVNMSLDCRRPRPDG